MSNRIRWKRGCVCQTVKRISAAKKIWYQSLRVGGCVLNLWQTSSYIADLSVIFPSLFCQSHFTRNDNFNLIVGINLIQHDPIAINILQRYNKSSFSFPFPHFQQN